MKFELRKGDRCQAAVNHLTKEEMGSELPSLPGAIELLEHSIQMESSR